MPGDVCLGDSSRYHRDLFASREKVVDVEALPTVPDKAARREVMWCSLLWTVSCFATAGAHWAVTTTLPDGDHFTLSLPFGLLANGSGIWMGVPASSILLLANVTRNVSCLSTLPIALSYVVSGLASTVCFVLSLLLDGRHLVKIGCALWVNVVLVSCTAVGMEGGARNTGGVVPLVGAMVVVAVFAQRVYWVAANALVALFVVVFSICYELGVIGGEVTNTAAFELSTLSGEVGPTHIGTSHSTAHCFATAAGISNPILSFASAWMLGLVFCEVQKDHVELPAHPVITNLVDNVPDNQKAVSAWDDVNLTSVDLKESSANIALNVTSIGESDINGLEEMQGSGSSSSTTEAKVRSRSTFNSSDATLPRDSIAVPMDSMFPSSPGRVMSPPLPHPLPPRACSIQTCGDTYSELGSPRSRRSSGSLKDPFSSPTQLDGDSVLTTRKVRLTESRIPDALDNTQSSCSLRILSSPHHSHVSLKSPRGHFGKIGTKRLSKNYMPMYATGITSPTSPTCERCLHPNTPFCGRTGSPHPFSEEGGLVKAKCAENAMTKKSFRVRAESFAGMNNPSQVKTIEKTVRWKKGALIGQGGFGKVHIGLNLDTGELMAVKNVEFSQKDKNLTQKLEQLRKEIKIMEPLDHTHIVKYFFTERVANSVNIFMEYVPGGSLLNLMKTFGGLSEETVVQYTFQILLGIAHLHQQGVVHRDIKCANVLLTVDGLVKLADFGASAMMDVDRVVDVQGTPCWMAPEVLRAQAHGWEADIWSLGCSVMEMLTGTQPWSHLNLTSQMHVLEWICSDKKVVLPSVFTFASQMFLNDCLQRDPTKRPAATLLIEHHYFLEDAEELAKEVAVRLERGSVSTCADSPEHESSPRSSLRSSHFRLKQSSSFLSLGTNVTSGSAIQGYLDKREKRVNNMVNARKGKIPSLPANNSCLSVEDDIDDISSVIGDDDKDEIISVVEMNVSEKVTPINRKPSKEERKPSKEVDIPSLGKNHARIVRASSYNDIMSDE